MKDIATRSDIEFLVNEFYKKVIIDDQIGFFFNKVVQLDWEIHIPIMYDFWESTLFGIPKYKGNPMLVHIELNKKENLTPEHFERWLKLWKTTIQNHFAGDKADEAVRKASQIGQLMQIKIKGQL